MFIFAHQDDEIAYMGLLRRLARSGRDIHIVWITDGAYSVSAVVRRRESLAALEVLGAWKPGRIAPGRLTFLDFPDGRSIDFAGEVVDRLTDKMREIGPSEVYTVAYEGGHPDHDLAHLAAVDAARRQSRPPLVYEASLYNLYRATEALGRLIPAETPVLCTRLSRGDRCFKLRAILKYRSQFWIVIPALLLAGRRILGPLEPYREVPAWNYRQPPHGGKLFYENWMLLRRKLGIRFADFSKAVSAVLSTPAKR